MSDPRLEKIKRDWLTTDWQLPLVYAAAEDIEWLVAEVERLEAVLKDIAGDKEIAGEYIRRKAKNALRADSRLPEKEAE